MNKMMIRRIMCVILCVACSFGTVSAVAKTKSELQSELNKKNEQKSELKERLEATKKKADTVLEKKNAIDAEIDVVNDEISDLESVIVDANSRIVQKEEEIVQLEGQIEAQDEVFKTRVRVMYENQNADYLQILLSSKNFSDFLLKMELITQILSNDKSILETMAATKKSLLDAKQVIVDEKESTEAAKHLVEEKKGQLQTKRSQQQALITELKAQEDADEEELKKIEKAEAELKSQIAKAEAAYKTSIPAKYTGGRFCWPSASSTLITSPYGYRKHPTTGVYKLHTGVDIGAGYGTNSLAAEAGVVTMAGWHTAYGYYIIISHGGGLSTLYAHHSRLLVSRGQSVVRGQAIGKVGSTGYSTGPHLHFEVLVNGGATNPMPYLQ